MSSHNVVLYVNGNDTVSALGDPEAVAAVEAVIAERNELLRKQQAVLDLCYQTAAKGSKWVAIQRVERALGVTEKEN